MTNPKQDIDIRAEIRKAHLESLVMSTYDHQMKVLSDHLIDLYITMLERLLEKSESIIDELLADVHFEKTYPAHTAYYQLDPKKAEEKLAQTIKDEIERLRT